MSEEIQGTLTGTGRPLSSYPDVSGEIRNFTVHDRSLGEAELHVATGFVEGIVRPEPEDGAVMYNAEQRQFFYYDSINRVWQHLEREEIIERIEPIIKEKPEPVITRANRGPGFAMRR